MLIAALLILVWSSQRLYSYPIVINKKVKAVAHSGKEKRNKFYDDSYTIEGANRGASQC